MRPPGSGVDGPRGWSSLGSEFACPYGKPGDTLWVRETWAPLHEHTADGSCGPSCCAYAADPPVCPPVRTKWRPSIYMPRWASRLTLEVTGVRVERLQDISEEDAVAEGIESVNTGRNIGWLDYSGDAEAGTPYVTPAGTERAWHSPISSYRTLWERINGAGSWDANPWVWVVEFPRVP